MSNIMRVIHWVIIFGLVLTGNTIYDQILGGIIAVISFFYAFTIVGNISNSLGYNSIMMSIVHWTIRTVIEASVICLSRSVYLIINDVLTPITQNSKLITVGIICIIYISLAELLKSKFGLRKNYW